MDTAAEGLPGDGGATAAAATGGAEGSGLGASEGEAASARASGTAPSSHRQAKKQFLTPQSNESTEKLLVTQNGRSIDLRTELVAVISQNNRYTANNRRFAQVRAARTRAWDIGGWRDMMSSLAAAGTWLQEQVLDRQDSDEEDRLIHIMQRVSACSQQISSGPSTGEQSDVEDSSSLN